MINKEIEMPAKLNDVLSDSFLEVEKIEKKKKFRRNSFLTMFCGCAVAIFFAYGFTNPVQASKIPLIGGIFAQLKDNGDIVENFDQKAVTVGANSQEEGNSLSAESSGVTIQPSQIYSDGYSVYVTAKFVFDNPIGEVQDYYRADGTGNTSQSMNILKANITVDGKEIPFDENIVIVGVQKSDTEFDGMFSIKVANTNGEPMKNAFQLKLQILNIAADIKGAEVDQDSILPSLNVSGDWDINLNVPVNVGEGKTFAINNHDSVSGFGINTIVKTDEKIVLNCYADGYNSDGSITEQKFHELFDEQNSLVGKNDKFKESVTYDDIKYKIPADISIFAVDNSGNIYSPFEIEELRGSSLYFMTNDRDITSLDVYFVRDFSELDEAEKNDFTELSNAGKISDETQAVLDNLSVYHVQCGF